MGYSLTVRGPRLIREIGRPRTDSGLLMDAAASRLGWSKSKLYRIEAGPIPRISTDDLEDVPDLYGGRSPQREAPVRPSRPLINN
jgi:hypothetical protein